MASPSPSPTTAHLGLEQEDAKGKRRSTSFKNIWDKKGRSRHSTVGPSTGQALTKSMSPRGSTEDVLDSGLQRNRSGSLNASTDDADKLDNAAASSPPLVEASPPTTPSSPGMRKKAGLTGDKQSSKKFHNLLKGRKGSAAAVEATPSPSMGRKSVVMNASKKIGNRRSSSDTRHSDSSLDIDEAILFAGTQPPDILSPSGVQSGLSTPTSSPKVSGKTQKKAFLPGLLGRQGRKAQEHGPFARQRAGTFFASGSNFEGTPVVSGSFLDVAEVGSGGAAALASMQTSPRSSSASGNMMSSVAGASSSSSGMSSELMMRLEGIPGGIVRKVYSCANMLGVVSQTGDLYLAASSRLHFSASGQPPPEHGQDLSAINVAREGFKLIRVKGMSGLKAVALGDFHSCAITEDGQIYTWGMNVNDPVYLTRDPPNGKGIGSVLSGQLGHRFSQYRFAEPLPLKDVKGKPLDVAVGATHTVVLTDQGVFTCGNPMAVGRPDSFVFDVLMKVPALDAIKISAVACGDDHTLAVVMDVGSVYSWGLNDHGQLGQARQVKYAAEPMLVAGSRNVMTVVAGPHHSVTVGRTGFVIVWGSNLAGQLGINSDDPRIFEPTLVESPLAEEHVVIHASCSKDCTFVVTDTGEVFQAGHFTATGLGGSSKVFRRVPIEAKYVGGVAVGRHHVVYLIDQALTHLMAQLMEPRSGSAEAFVRKLLRLVQVAVANGSAGLINGIQSRVNRLSSESEPGVPRIRLDGAVLRCALQPTATSRSAVHIVRVTNSSAFRIECDCWWSLANVSDGVEIKFTPSSFTVDEGESTFVRVETTLTDSSLTSGSFQTLCQLTARRHRRLKGAGSMGGFASHYFFMDISFSDSDKERDPALVQSLVDTMGTYVPRAILRELHENPAPPTGPTKVSFPGAVLFIDVSGFTALNARLSNLGPAGPEQVSMHLNRYFGQLIDAVHRHGGDVLKFAGDALICLFGSPQCEERLATLVLRSVQCAWEMQNSELREYDSHQDFQLQIHVGVGCGEINWLHLGGENSHYEHIIMGDPMLQLETAVSASKSGEVVLSADAFALISDKVTGSLRGECNYLIEEIVDPIPVDEVSAVSATPAMEAGLRCFLPTSVLARIDALHTSWLAELRRVTVIFVNLTSLTYEKGTEVRLQAINDVLCSMQKIVFRYEGMIRQFIVDDKGTVLIAAFGVPPFGHEDDALRGIKTAWEIHHTLLEAKVSSSIGVTSGKVFCGSVGSSKRQEYAMVGDIVNLSARLMMVAKDLESGIVVDETTRDYTNDQVHYQSLEPVHVKGRDERVVIAKPTGFKETATEHHSHQNLPNIMVEESNRRADAMPEIPMVGRKAEMGLLQLQVAKLQAMKKSAMDARGSTKTFLLSGLAGLGKTRIINELARLCRKQSVEYYIGQCDSLEKTKPFFVFQTILEQLINLELWKQRNQKMLREEMHTSMAEHWQANSASVAAAFGIESDSNWAEYLPLLNHVLPLGLPDNDMCRKLDSDKRHMLTVSFMAYLIQARAREKPVVLIVEDLQWIDASSMELLAAVAEESSANTKGILMVLSQRSPPQHPHYKQLLQLTGVEELKLVPMSDADCQQIACSTLGVPTSAWLPKLDKALAKAHGNPLFAMEIAYSLRESGAVEVEDGKLVLNKLGKKMEIPETIEGMIGSRIDQLPSGPQLLLKVASVIGMEFTAELLTAIYPIDSQRDTILASLKELLEVGLLERAVPSSPVYRFKNDTVREVTYMRMLFTQRQQLHLKIAQHYEAQRSSNTDGRLVLVLASHWRGALLNNPEASFDNIVRASSYLISSASICIEEENREEAERFLLDAQKLAESITGSANSADRELILASVEGMRKKLPPLVGFSKQ